MSATLRSPANQNGDAEEYFVDEQVVSADKRSEFWQGTFYNAYVGTPSSSTGTTELAAENGDGASDRIDTS